MAAHSSAARRRAASSCLVKRSMSRAVTMKAAALTSARTKIVSRSESPPTQLANAWTAVATGPYTLGSSRHGRSTASAITSPGRSAAPCVYGLIPSVTMRPYAA
ncbi:hypothetical protein GCM10009734_64540 [Nonomuraea bangladeshensis]